MHAGWYSAKYSGPKVQLSGLDVRTGEEMRADWSLCWRTTIQMSSVGTINTRSQTRPAI